jgi:hypothetical protein
MHPTKVIIVTSKVSHSSLHSPPVLYDFDFINLPGLKPLNDLKKNDLFGVFSLFIQLLQWLN